jgi:SAM-dependent methyltransferase
MDAQPTQESAPFYDRIARYYDAENALMTDDLPFYSELAEEYGDPILEVGCGTGRVLLHLAEAGYSAEGMDFSAQMLERGQRKLKGRADLRGKAHFHQADARTYISERRYALILFSYNAFMHFRTPSDQLAVLRQMKSLLKPDGLLVFDLPNAGETFASADDGALTFERSFTEPESGNLVMQQSISRLDRAEQLQYVQWVYDEIAPDGLLRRTVAPITLRYTFAAELALLLAACGLASLASYGDYDGTPYADGCDRLIVLAGRGNGS